MSLGSWQRLLCFGVGLFFGLCAAVAIGEDKKTLLGVLVAGVIAFNFFVSIKVIIENGRKNQWEHEKEMNKLEVERHARKYAKANKRPKA